MHLRRIIGISAAILVIAFVLLALVKIAPKLDHPSDMRDGPRQLSNLPSCGDKQDLFTTSPLDSASYNTITPLGNIAPPDHTFPTPHTYIDLANRSIAAPIYAPGDITITQVSSNQGDNLPGQSYSINFAACREVTGYFNHINQLSDELLADIGKLSRCETHNPGSGNFTSCLKDVAIAIDAGTLIGYAGGPHSDSSAALDFGLRDTRETPGKLLRQPLKYDKSMNHVVCPYDYYASGSGKNLVTSKLQAGAINLVPTCGTVYHDAAGTAQGRWFSPDDSITISEANHLSLVPSNQDASEAIISIGNSELGTSMNVFKTSSSGLINRDFESVTADNNIYCYQQTRGNTASLSPIQPWFIFLQLTSPTSLTIERIKQGSCPTDPNQLSFSSQAVTFSR